MYAPAISNFVQSSSFIAVLIDAAIKSCVVLALAGTASLLWRRASAATRHLIWFLAVICLPFLPLSSSFVPVWQKPLWSISTNFDSGNRISLALELAPAQPQNLSTSESQMAPNDPRNHAGNKLQTNNRQIAARLNANWLFVAFIVWSGGILLMLISVIGGQIWLGKLARQSQPLHEERWQRLLDEAREKLGLRRNVRLLQSSDNIMPLTWGWREPVVLLPAEAGQWPDERRRVVLLHEIAHVKRHDCLTHLLTRIVCGLYWFNPLVWVAARRMCVERERAADDLVLRGGCKASDYAGHLVDIARSFRRVPQVAGIAMARGSGLEKRVSAIVDPSRIRQLRPIAVWSFSILTAALVLCFGGWSAESNRTSGSGDSSLRQQQIDQLKAFSAAKEKQSKILAEAEGEQIGPDYQQFSDAATRGDVNAVTNLYEDFKKRHGQYSHSTEVRGRILPHTSFWSPVLEVCLAYDHVANCDPKYTQIAVHDIINSIPRGSIYFGGTDPGRGLPTAFSKSQIDADPFYTLTQNALADSSYLDYLRMTYGVESKLLNQFIRARQSDPQLKSLDADFNQALEKLNSLYANTNYDLNGPEISEADQTTTKLKDQINELAKVVWAKLKEQAGTNSFGKTIYIPSSEELQKCFADYSADAARRHQHDQQFPNEPRQLKPGEDVKMGEGGRIQVGGQVAVMSINALMAKLIFDKNPDHEFYVEESFPLDWMFPHLEPNGLIMKINREPVSALPDDVIRKDHEYWQKLVAGMIGDWLTDTSVQTVADFAEKTFVRKDLSGFKGDPNFVRDNYAPKMFSKWRSAIGGIYLWRLGLMPGVPTPPEYLPKNDAERQRMIKEADFAYRQAFAICPYSPEVVFRYVNFLTGQSKRNEALVIAEAASHADPKNGSFPQLIHGLQQGNVSPSARLQAPQNPPVPQSSETHADNAAPAQSSNISTGGQKPDIDDLAPYLGTNIIAESDWSEPVRSGPHVLRARMLLSHIHVSPYTATGLYLDLWNVGPGSTPMQIYFDPVNSIHCEFMDATGKPAPKLGGGGSVGPHTNVYWITLPYGSTTRLQVNIPTKSLNLSDDRKGEDGLSVMLPFADSSDFFSSSFGINPGDTNVYYLSGTFTVSSPTTMNDASRSPGSEWTGTLQLPRMKVFLRKS